MIQIEINGRLGNHLFQYAFGISASRQLGTRFSFKNEDRLEIDEYFELPSYKRGFLKIPFLIRLYDRVKSMIDTTRNVVVLDEYQTQVDLKDNVTYRGHFQSYDFFKEHEQLVRREFTIKEQFTKDFNSRYGDIFSTNEVIGVHIRRGDYLDVHLPELGSKGLQLPISYYRKCLKEICSNKNSIVYFASDDIEFVKKQFENKPNYIFSTNELIIDFIALSSVDKLITSNSSFSWWAGFLNQRCQKVYAPKHHLGFKVGKTVPAGIMYEGFDWVDVY
ncbi:MAG: alpha-1,2-fucosyltransferase [Cyclobacteriaceae bacterium]